MIKGKKARWVAGLRDEGQLAALPVVLKQGPALLSGWTGEKDRIIQIANFNDLYMAEVQEKPGRTIRRSAYADGRDGSNPMLKLIDGWRDQVSAQKTPRRRSLNWSRAKSTMNGVAE
jgi:hypothetical protein